jgi:AbrB family looped-hinge helix DNA binding protein
MEVAAKLSSKGQITVPKAVRDALDLHEGDQVVFRVVNGQAVLLRTPDFVELAGSIAVPAARRGTAWDDVRRHVRRERASRR